MADQPKHQAPEGCEPYDLGGQEDLGALSSEQQDKLNKFKMKTRVENEQYLRHHPEVETLLTGFLSDVLKQRPEAVRDFAADYFTSAELPDKLQISLEDREEKLKQNKVLMKM